jgi:hypothetical protein
VLPGRLGVRFALEALFIVLLAVGAGLADLRPAFIVLVMAAAWLVVALIEFTAERSARSPVSYLLPEPEAAPEAEHEPERVFGPPVEERTVVAPPQELEDTEERVAQAEAAVEPEPVEVVPAAEEAPIEAEAESLELPRRRVALLRRRRKAPAEPELVPEAEPFLEPEPEEAEAAFESEPARGRFRSLLRRREQEPEPIPEPPPRHVKLLPRRPSPEPAPAAREVAELFEPREDGADAEETAG